MHLNNQLRQMALLWIMFLSTHIGHTKQVTQQDIETILKLHNEERRAVKPEAANMKKMEWDPKIAEVAQKWSDKCVFRHSWSRAYGENIAAGYGSRITTAYLVNLWTKEKNDWSYPMNCKRGKVCGHYTQEIWHNSAKIGCGITNCPRLFGNYPGTFIVCNYARPGNYIGQNPYKSGRPCSKCDADETCESKLCVKKSRSKSPAAEADTKKPQKGSKVDKSSKLTHQDIETILKLHNDERRAVKPEAANMKKMEWDPKIAEVAQKWSDKCVFRHSWSRAYGENIAAGYGSMMTTAFLINLWTKEKNNWSYPMNCKKGRVCGHYTQEIWHNSAKIGCGITNCPKLFGNSPATFIVCNYARPGNYIGQNPYKSGRPCSQCEADETCESKLCVKKSNSQSPDF